MAAIGAHAPPYDEAQPFLNMVALAMWPHSSPAALIENYGQRWSLSATLMVKLAGAVTWVSFASGRVV